MPASNEEQEFTSYVVELMQLIGPVRSKGMFGLIADSVLYLKADKETENEFKARGLEAFTYNKKGKEFKMSYYQAPEEALDDGEEMNTWATKAYCTALRATSKKRKK